jgi:hypothetical protein
METDKKKREAKFRWITCDPSPWLISFSVIIFLLFFFFFDEIGVARFSVLSYISLKFDYHIISGMGTKLEYAINLLATSHNSSSVSVRCVDDLEYLQTRGLSKDLQVSGIDKFCSSMDRMPEKHNIDFIKKTMQLHDDIFKQQVSFKSSLTYMFCGDQCVSWNLFTWRIFFPIVGHFDITTFQGIVSS